MNSAIDLGSQVRAFRKKRKLSLTALSRLTGIAPSNLSSIELNKSSPTLSTLVKIAEAFHMRLSAFLDEVVYSDTVSCAAREAKVEKSSSRGVTVALLTAGVSMGSLRVRVFSVESNSEHCPLGGEGTDRFIYCVQGRVAAHVGSDTVFVDALDGLYVRSGVSATIENAGDKNLVMLCISNSSTR